MQKQKKMKGQAVSLGDVPGLIIILVIIGVVLAFGALFMVEMRETADEQNLTYQDSIIGIVNDSIEGLETVGDWQPTIAVAVIIAVALAIVIGLFAFRKSGGGL